MFKCSSSMMGAKGTAKVTTERKEKTTVRAFSVLLLPQRQKMKLDRLSQGGLWCHIVVV